MKDENRKIDIFDLTCLSDIDKKVISELLSERKNETDNKILELFKIKDTLNINEILIGLYREYKLIKTRTNVIQRICALKQQKKIFNKRILGVKGIYTNKQSKQK